MGRVGFLREKSSVRGWIFFFFFCILKVLWHLGSVWARCCGTCVWSIAASEESPWALGAWEVLLEDLSRLGSYSVREADFELHNQVSSLAGGLGEGQPLPT